MILSNTPHKIPGQHGRQRASTRPDERSSLKSRSMPSGRCQMPRNWQELGRVAGSNPLVAGKHPRKVAQKVGEGSPCINIYTDIIPGISVSGGTHGDCHNLYHEEIKNHTDVKVTDQQAADLAKVAVCGWVEMQGKNPKVTIRPDREPQLLIDGIEQLESIGIKAQNISFSTEQGTSINVKMIGKMNQVRTVNFLTGRQKKSYITDPKRFVTLPSGNKYFYVRNRGERLLTPEQAEKMLDVLEDRKAFIKRLDEVIRYRGQHSTTASWFDVDFLLVKDDLTRNTDNKYSKEILEEFRKVHELAHSLTEWTAEEQESVIAQMEVFLAFFRRKTHELFHHDNFQDSQWRNLMCVFLRGLRDEGELMSLGPEYTGALKVLPGGMIGHHNKDGKLTVGPKILSAEEAKALIPDGDLPTTAPVVVLPEKEEESVLVYERHSKDKDTYTERSYIFDPRASQETIDLLNDILASRKTIEYAYACEVPESLSARDALLKDVADYWDPPRQVHVIMFKQAGQAESRLLARRIQYPTYFWENVYHQDNLSHQEAKRYSASVAKFIQLQHLCYRLWNFDTPEARIVKLTEEIPALPDQPKVRRTALVKHYVRQYVNGRPVDRDNRFQHPSRDFTWCVGKVKAVMAAGNIASHRSYFCDGDEVVNEFDREGHPTNLCLADPHSSFPSVEVLRGRKLADDARLYATDLAADLAAIRIILESDTEAFAHQRSLYDDSSVTLMNAFYRDFFTERLQKLIDFSAENRQYLEDRVAQEYNSWNKVPERFDMRPRWKLVLDKLEETDPQKVIQAIERLTGPLSDFYVKIGSGLDTLTDTDHVVREAERMLMSSCWQTNGISQQTLIRIMSNDPEISTLPANERLFRILAMRASSWTKRIGASMEDDVLSVAADCWKACDGDFIKGQIAFATAASYDLAGVALHPGVPERLFEALYDGPDPGARIQTLRERGYFLS